MKVEVLREDGREGVGLITKGGRGLGGGCGRSGGIG